MHFRAGMDRSISFIILYLSLSKNGVVYAFFWPSECVK